MFQLRIGWAVSSSSTPLDRLSTVEVWSPKLEPPPSLGAVESLYPAGKAETSCPLALASEGMICGVRLKLEKYWSLSGMLSHALTIAGDMALTALYAALPTAKPEPAP